MFTLQALVSFKRVNDFLLLEEVEDETVEKDPKSSKSIKLKTTSFPHVCV
jgi:hypothetical protein